MALKITLKPGERLIIGGAVVTNGNSTSCDLVIENKTPILRQKDILTEEKADSPCRRIYYTIQLMYIDEDYLAKYHKLYWDLVREVVQAAPSTVALIDSINEHILCRRYYQALKQTKRLIDYEQEAIEHVSGSAEGV
ncbi:MAG: flagellar protein FlbT [Deltaproteobacteria bacterium]|jgi:flagellar biosynthesis repressor protein FlbT|nr:MAG: flagellar protein FlbT [Deltaproteobacteria bacterium]